MIEKFVSEDGVVRLRNLATSSNPGLGSPALEENIFSIDSISLLIGNNGSGKTRLLEDMWHAMDRWEGRGWRSHWRPVLHPNSLTTEHNIGVVLFSHAPNKTKMRESFTDKCVDASIISRRRYSPESLLGHEEFLRDVTEIDTHFTGELRVEIRPILNRCVELLLNNVISLPPSWEDLQYELNSLQTHYSKVIRKAGIRSTSQNEIYAILGVDPDFDLVLNGFARKFYDEAARARSMARISAVLAVLHFELKSTADPDKLLQFALRKYFRLQVSAWNYKPEKDTNARISDRIKILEEMLFGKYGVRSSVLGPNQVRITIGIHNKVELSALRGSAVGELFTLGWSDISSGQWALVVQLIEIRRAFVKAARQKSVSSILVLIDEGDAFLHLEWQRHYITVLDRMLSNLKSLHAKKIHYVQVVIATHSPVLASDVPRTYVNRLREGKVVDSSPSFAAPYQSLISSAFSAKTIGAYATKAIQEVVTNVRAGNVTKRDRYVAGIVDDPIIQRELDEMVGEELR